jgi:hypothetical protein
MPAKLALALLLSCIVVLPAAAREARMLSPDSGGCQTEHEEATEDETGHDEKQSGPQAMKSRPPMRRNADGGTTTVRPPRWHSFLPGMFR